MSGCWSKDLLLLIATVIAKFGFSILFLSGSVYDHSGSHQDRLKELCGILIPYPNHWVEENWQCYHHVKEGLMITGLILLFISILTDAFLRMMKGNEIFVTIMQILGSLFLMVSSAIDWSLLLNYERHWSRNFSRDHPNFEAGFWIAGGLIIATCQPYIIYFNRSEGILYFVTLVLSFLAWTMFIVYGILRIDSVITAIIGDRSGYYDVFVYYWNTTTTLLISGKVFLQNYTQHAPIS